MVYRTQSQEAAERTASEALYDMVDGRGPVAEALGAVINYEPVGCLDGGDAAVEGLREVVRQLREMVAHAELLAERKPAHHIQIGRAPDGRDPEPWWTWVCRCGAESERVLPAERVAIGYAVAHVPAKLTYTITREVADA